MRLPGAPRACRMCARCQAATISIDSKGLRPLKMTFALQYHCQFGQNLSILGSSACLGSWDTGQCVDMQWTENDVWKVEVEVSSRNTLGPAIEYKYVVRDQDGGIVAWKPGDNYMLEVPVEDVTAPERVRICDAWDNSCRQVEVELFSASSQPKIQEKSEEKAAQALKEEAEAALEHLKAIVENSTSVLDSVEPTSKEAFAADQAVASAAAKAQKLTKALNEYKRTGLLKELES